MRAAAMVVVVSAAMAGIVVGWDSIIDFWDGECDGLVIWVVGECVVVNGC